MNIQINQQGDGSIVSGRAKLLLSHPNTMCGLGGSLALPFLAFCLAGTATSADEPKLEPIVVGQPVRLEVFPATINLSGPRSRMQLVVTGHYADGSVQDLTRACQFASTDTRI